MTTLQPGAEVIVTSKYHALFGKYGVVAHQVTSTIFRVKFPEGSIIMFGSEMQPLCINLGEPELKPFSNQSEAELSAEKSKNASLSHELETANTFSRKLIERNLELKSRITAAIGHLRG